MLKCSDNLPKICRKRNAFCENVKLTYKYCQISYRYCNRIQNFSLKIDNWYHFFYKINNSWHTYCLVHETIFDKNFAVILRACNICYRCASPVKFIYHIFVLKATLQFSQGLNTFFGNFS